MSSVPNDRLPVESNQRTVLGKDPSELVLCYLACPQDAARGYLGAIMLADARTRPLHFAYVSPVRPSKTQRILYGKVLDEYVKIYVIANKLISALPKIPDVLFVESADLLPARKIAKWPIAHLAKNNENTAGSSPSISTLTYDTGDNILDREIVGSVISELEMQFDLVEPFSRIREALLEAIKPNPV